MQRGGKHFVMPTNATLPEELPTSIASQTLGVLPNEGAGIYAMLIFSLFFHIHTIRPIPFTVYSSIKTLHFINKFDNADAMVKRPHILRASYPRGEEEFFKFLSLYEYTLTHGARIVFWTIVPWNLKLRYVGIIQFIFQVLQLLLIGFTQQY